MMTLATSQTMSEYPFAVIASPCLASLNVESGTARQNVCKSPWIPITNTFAWANVIQSSVHCIRSPFLTHPSYSFSRSFPALCSPFFVSFVDFLLVVRSELLRFLFNRYNPKFLTNDYHVSRIQVRVDSNVLIELLIV